MAMKVVTNEEKDPLTQTDSKTTRDKKKHYMNQV